MIGKIEDLKPLLGDAGSVFDKMKGKLFIETEKDKGWSIWANDSFILGGIHGHRDFYLHGDRAALDFLDPDVGEEHMFKVTQREVIGLTNFGHAIKGDSGTPRTKHVCTDNGLADCATFKKYSELMAGFVGGSKGFRNG